MTVLEAARWFNGERQIPPVPVPYKQKGSRIPNWNSQLIEPAEFARYFNGTEQNIGVLTGIERPDYGFLADVDLDALAAVYAWREYSIPTAMMWGHGEVTPTHFLYWANGLPHSMKYLDPTAEPQEACIIELRCQDKGGHWLQTLAPPSVHPSGEPIEFVGGAGHPAKVAGQDLGRRVRLTFAASLLGLHAADGKRHQIFIALAGALRRAEWELTEAQRFVRAAFRVIWHEAADLGAANQEANSTYQHYDDGKDTTGLRTLSTLLDERIFRELKQRLGLESQEDWMRQQEAPKRAPRVLPPQEDIENLRNRQIVMPHELIEKVLVAPGLTLLVSPSKVGKTILAMQLAMSVANGLALFDYYRVRQGPVLFIEFDDLHGDASLKDFLLKCRASRAGQPIGIVLKPEEEFSMTDPEFMPWLGGLIEQRKAALVILDSYTSLRGYRSGSDIVKLESTELTKLNHLARDLHCGMTMVHHDSKSSSTLDRYSRAAGSYALQQATESVIALSRYRELPESDDARLLSVRSRHQRGLQATITFREVTLDFDMSLEGHVAEEFPRVRQLVRLFRCRASFEAKEIIAETGWKPASTYNLMNLLTGAGVVLKESKGWSWDPGFRRTMEQI